MSDVVVDGTSSDIDALDRTQQKNREDDTVGDGDGDGDGDSDSDASTPKRRLSSAPWDFAFYDDLRRSPTASFRPMLQPTPSVGRAMHVATDPDRLGSNNASVVTCHVPIFLRYTMYDERAEGYRDVSSLSYGGTGGALLAMHHFNNGDGSVVEELEGINDRCNIRFTTEVVDTQSSSIVAVQHLAGDFTHRSAADVERPLPCAVMGAAWYTVSQSMATVTGVYDLLQVSPSSSSMSLDSMSQYPLFSRTHPSDEAKGRLAVEYFDRVLDTKNFGILFINSEMGISLAKMVLDAAAGRNMTATSVSFPEDASPESLRNSMAQLRELGFNYFLGVFFPLPYDYVMGVAAEEKVAGPGKFWLVTGHLAESFAGGNTTVRTGSSAAIGSSGLAILHDDGGEGLTHWEKFRTQWKRIKYDQDALDYINSKQPKPPAGTNLSFRRPGEYFDQRPSHYSQFSYDAIAGMGIAACRAADRSALPDNYFTGREHHSTFLSHPFVGATGNVSFANNSHSRDGFSVYYFISRIREIDRPTANTSVLSGTTSVFFDAKWRQWKPWDGAGKFVYSDGSTVPPPELPAYTEDQHGLATSVRAVCLFLAGAVMVTSVGLSIFVFAKRKSQVITASQPPFLYMLCLGTFVMSSAIIPLTIDDSIADENGCDIACMSRIWLMSIGFTITFSALYSKTRRINKLVKMSLGFERVTLKASDVMVPFFNLFLINIIILSMWTAFAPLEWERKKLQEDRFGRQIESVGGCYNDGWLPYGVALLLVNGGSLLLAIAEAYRARKITTSFSESKYIAMAVVCIFQALFFGVPLFFITKAWPTAETFVLTAIIFIICMAVLLLIFVPKIVLIRKGANLRPSLTRSSSSARGSVVRRRSRGSSVVIVGPAASRTAARSSSSSANPAMGLEEDIWNATHLDGLQSLQQKLGRASLEIEILQKEIDAHKWARGDTPRSGNVDAAPDPDMA